MSSDEFEACDGVGKLESLKAAIAQSKSNQPSLFISGFDEAEDDGIEPVDDDSPCGQVLKAAEDGSVELLERLLDENPDLIQTSDPDGYTPLHRAAYGDHIQVVKVLINRGANVCAITKDGWQPLHSAALWSCANTVEYLLRSPNVDINARTNGGLTALHLVASSKEEGCLETAQVLLLHPKADPHIRSQAGETCYEIARRNSAHMMNMFQLCHPSILDN